MYIITMVGSTDEGAFSLRNEDGESVLCIFKENDDAQRYAMLLNESDKYPAMEVYEVEDDAVVYACEMHGYEYVVFTKNDIVIPPFDDDYFSDD